MFLLGHCHPAVVAAVREQLERNPLATRLFLNPELAQAVADLAGITPAGLDYVFLTISGAEATELGLKLARLAGKRHVIAMHGGFHGKTLGWLGRALTSAARHVSRVMPLAAWLCFPVPTWPFLKEIRMRTVFLRLYVPDKSASDVYATLANFELGLTCISRGGEVWFAQKVEGEQ